ncbi:MAG: FAD-dependent monooxygenase [Gammaproteobacteria bacterium]|nr:FAD-dependent monooxygenase [Gammaproteobacteria bacterium]
MSASGERVAIAGAGPTGALLAILLQRRGYRVTIYDARPDPRTHPAETGRSINLALAARGIDALRRVGVYESLREAMVPMRGRLIHDRSGATALQPYGSRPEEIIHSISRSHLGRLLVEIAADGEGVEMHFEHRLEAADFAAGIAQVRDLRRDALVEVPMRPLIACDGGGSQMRRSLAAARLIDAEERDLEHGYKELTIPADAGGRWRMQREALHVWPRGDHMLIALPNHDGSFTATLFLPKRGAPGFDSLGGDLAVETFLQSEFADAAALMPDRLAEFRDHPTGFLGTVHAAPWHHRGMTALVGDAAHAIVPFHGQGMNCCFEDCIAFDACVAAHVDWESRFAAFFALRKPNTDAIAAMALENYREMRESVADPRFQLQSALARELERLHPRRFIPRYSMVMFHSEIPYALAARRGLVQAGLLAELTEGRARLEEIDFGAAARLVDSRLPPIDQDLSSVTKL